MHPGLFEHAESDMNALIDEILKNLCPTCTVVVSSLPPSKEKEVSDRIAVFNPALKALVAKKQKAGQHVLFNDGNSALSTKNYKDTTHPDDVTSHIIGERFALVIEEAGKRGWISPITKREEVVAVPFSA